MQNFQRISQDFEKSLSLQYEPVGVTLYRESDTLPEDISITHKDFKDDTGSPLTAPMD